MSAPIDCACPRAKHKHGTPGAYQRDRCRCFDCRLSMWNAYATSSYRSGEVFIPRAGTIRRLEALHAVGWSGADVARALGVTKQAVVDLRRNPSPVILTYTAARVETVYNALWDATPTPGAQTERTKRWAARHGWLPPMAWDDDEIGDPAATPHVPTEAGAWDHQPCGTPAAARRHYRNGEPLDEACRQAARRERNDRKKAA